MRPMDYAKAGVNIDAGNRAVQLLKNAVQTTYTPQVLAGVGAFGGLFDVSMLKDYDHPVLVASTDGVGTKTKVAAALGAFENIGRDIVNHCINDILVQGAKPLFFMDYVAMGQLSPELVASIVTGAASACRAAGCALLGGETAEMPGVYQDGEFDVVGTIVGVVERDSILDGQSLVVGDAILGLPSSGLHTNGFSLARMILAEQDLSIQLGDTSWGEALLAPHKSYIPAFNALQAAAVPVKALAHITGGGLVENPPRVFPLGLGAVIDEGSWPVPLLFSELLRLGQIAPLEAYRTFNMGLGMLVFLPQTAVAAAQAALTAAGEPSFLVGHMVAGAGVSFRGR
jgi:phosphoribosylformylglycinamidine cyclo-ligase